MSDKIFYKVARLCVKAAVMPFPVNNHVIEIIKTIINEEQARFIMKAFKKTWISEEEILIKTQMDKKMLEDMLDVLTHIGIVINLPHPRTGFLHYRVVPFFPGLLEFTLMKGEKGETQKRLAQLWEKVFSSLIEGTQANYENTMQLMKGYNVATDRVVPVEKEVKSGQDTIIPTEDIEKLLEKEEHVALAVCYCRHRKDLIEEPCKRTDHRDNCVVLGRTAQFCIKNDFAKAISKEEALKIIRRAEDEGLVHKIFHSKLDPKAEIDGICSCCPCCCGTFTNYLNGGLPAMSYSSYLAKIDHDSCVGCGTCVERCPVNAISLVDVETRINEAMCLGCGVCAHHCPEEAIQLERIGERLVFIPPPKIS